MKRLAMVVAACGAMAGTPVLAQDATPTPRAQELAARYVELMDLGQMMQEAMLGQDSLTDEAMTGYEGLGLDTKGAAVGGQMPSFVPEGSMDAMQPMIALMESVMVQAVAEIYPESELESLVEFYDTTEGRQIMARQGALQVRMNGIMLERMPEMMEAMGLGDLMQGLNAGAGGGSTGPTRSMTPMQPRTTLPGSGDDLVEVITADW